MTKYNGHPSYNYWNVALWIGNDEGLYRLALDCMKRSRTRRIAAESFVETLVESGWKHRTTPTGAICTPDGAPWRVASVMHGMRGLS